MLNTYSELLAFAEKLCKHHYQENHDRISPSPNQSETHRFYKAQSISFKPLDGESEPIEIRSLKYDPEHIVEIRWLSAIYKLRQVLQFGYEVLSHYETALDGCQPSLTLFLAIAFDEP